jgi:hypothetical protein
MVNVVSNSFANLRSIIPIIVHNGDLSIQSRKLKPLYIQSNPSFPCWSQAASFFDDYRLEVFDGRLSFGPDAGRSQFGTKSEAAAKDINGCISPDGRVPVGEGGYGMFVM